MFNTESKIEVENGDDPFLSYIVMEELIDKLILLNYNKEFISELKMKPIHRHYFMVPKNPGEQFYLFTSLAAWLIRKCGKHFEQPEEFDDPNSTIANILNQVRDMGFQIDFPPNRLKQGVGEQVVYVLNKLADAALSKLTDFQWKEPKPELGVEIETEIIDEESELNLDKIEEELELDESFSEESDDDEQNMFNIDNLLLNRKQLKTEENLKFQDLLVNNNQEAWMLELERVLPQLKVTIKGDNRDWRNHFEQIQSYRDNINNLSTSTKSQLTKLHQDVAITLEKIDNREKHLNRELGITLDRYKTLQDELVKLQQNYKNISGGVTERTRELDQLTDQLERVKQQLDERGNSMTDGTPLVQIKKGITKIRDEITEMDVRIGVLENMLLQAKLKDAKLLEEDLVNNAMSL